MDFLFVLFLVSFVFVANGEECSPKTVIKTWQTHSPCARREDLGVLIGHGYNINLPHTIGDFAALGINPSHIRKAVIMQGPSKCDCTKSFCLTPEQSERLFQINIDRAEKQISRIIRSISSPMPCCDIQNSLIALTFTFGIDFIKRVPDALSHINNGEWQKLGTALLEQSWCTVTDHCSPLAERIQNGCNNATDNLGCSPPTPKACDAAGQYCCGANNTCCLYRQVVSQAYWCCPLNGAACCTSSNSCCPKAYPVCCGATNSCCFTAYPVCCFPGTSQAYCCGASTPVCLGDQHCGSLDPNVEPVLGKVNKANQHEATIVH